MAHSKLAVSVSEKPKISWAPGLLNEAKKHVLPGILRYQASPPCILCENQKRDGSIHFYLFGGFLKWGDPKSSSRHGWPWLSIETHGDDWGSPWIPHFEKPPFLGLKIELRWNHQPAIGLVYAIRNGYSYSSSLRLSETRHDSPMFSKVGKLSATPWQDARWILKIGPVWWEPNNQPPGIATASIAHLSNHLDWGFGGVLRTPLFEGRWEIIVDTAALQISWKIAVKLSDVASESMLQSGCLRMCHVLCLVSIRDGSTASETLQLLASNHHIVSSPCMVGSLTT